MTGSDVPMATPRVSAGALFLDEGGRVLLVQPTYKEQWDIPGGYVEPGESPLQACRREVQEELGLTPPIGAPLVVDWAPATDEGDKLLFIFDGGTLTRTELARAFEPNAEIAGWDFVPVDELDRHLPDRLARRVHVALSARQDGAPAYAEHGQRVS